MSDFVIALDVGGTSVHAATLIDGVIIQNTITTYPSLANKSKVIIINHFKNIVLSQVREISNSTMNSNVKIKGVGIAFPGPTDYKKGISYIKDLDKYESLYKVNLQNELFHAISTDRLITRYLSNDFSIHMENDAVLFAIGEYIKYKSEGYKKLACFTLGTGIGSTFIKDEIIVKGDFGIPGSGFIYNAPFKDGIIEDYISKRGIHNLAVQAGFNVDHISIRDLANLAKNGDSRAKNVFDCFGKLLTEALEPFLDSFRPEVIVFGGQISKSFELVKNSFLKNSSTKKPRVETFNSPINSTFIGANSLIE